MTDVNNSADPSGEAGQETGQDPVNPNEDMIPRERFNEQMYKERERRRAIEASLEELKKEVAGQRQPQTRVYSEQELQGYVDGGQITEAQMHQALRQQDNATTRTSLKSEIAAELRAEAQDEKLSSQIAAYTRKVPDIDVDGSEASMRVERAYQFNVQDCGMPTGKGARLSALKQVYGPAETIQPKGQAVVEPYSETGGAGGAPSTPAADGPKGLTAGEKAYYGPMIGGARYPTWKDVETELKWANPNVRNRQR